MSLYDDGYDSGDEGERRRDMPWHKDDRRRRQYRLTDSDFWKPIDLVLFFDWNQDYTETHGLSTQWAGASIREGWFRYHRYINYEAPTLAEQCPLRGEKFHDTVFREGFFTLRKLHNRVPLGALRLRNEVIVWAYEARGVYRRKNATRKVLHIHPDHISYFTIGPPDEEFYPSLRFPRTQRFI